MNCAEPSLVMNAERTEPKLLLCPSCAQNMRLIEGLSVSAHCQMYVRLNAATAACLISKNMSHRNQRALIANDNENDLAPVHLGEFGMILRLGAMINVVLIVVAYGSSSMARCCRNGYCYHGYSVDL